MGWRPPPPDDPFGGNCNDFPEGQTPKKFIAFTSGIEYCHPIWDPELSRPPASFELTQRIGSPCTWDWEWGIWSAVYKTSEFGNSVFNITFSDVFLIFEGQRAAVSFGFENSDHVCQAGLYYATGGAAHLVARAETTAPSLSKLAVLAGVPDDVDTKCDVLPIDKNTGWVRFFREDIQVKSKMKFTLLDIF